MAFNESRFKCERTLKVASKHKCDVDDNDNVGDDHHYVKIISMVKMIFI